MERYSFFKDLFNNLGNNWNNNLENNFDFLRFGSPEREVVNGGYALLEIKKYLNELDRFYNILEDDYSRYIFIQALSFRILGHRKIKMPLSTPEYWNAIKTIASLADKDNYIEVIFTESNKTKLFYINLNDFNVPVKLFNTPTGIISQFFIRNYEYRIDNERFIGAREGDVVIDGGGCWGDTALYFANQVGDSGKVYSFEFIPSNLDILYKNIGLNPEMSKRIQVVPAPLWESSGIEMYFKDYGPGSSIKLEPFEGMQGRVSSISIDRFVEENHIKKVDFIKMDIEGSEQKAIKGAINTLKRFTPQLAISIYHNFANDFAHIANMLDVLKLGYHFFLSHFSIHHEETVLFATTEGKL